MKDSLLNLANQLKKEIQKVKTENQLLKLHLLYFGKNGQFTTLLKRIPTLSPLEKREVGKLTNQIKKELEALFSKRKEEIQEAVRTSSIWFDVTQPGEKTLIGHLHPQTRVLKEFIDIFTYLGYQVTDGPEIENDYYNFESLNIPKDHPSRDTQMTLYTDLDNLILRTQTSAMQVRVMEKTKPPIRVIVPGKCFRYEQVDPSHGFEFWHMEGFLVDRGIRLTDLLGTLSFVLKRLFGQQTKLRFACTNFPFVEPGVDTYMECTVCNGRGCSFCKNTGWSEIMPSGMIHPNVLKYAKIDPKKYNGFAFAIGLSRIVTLKHRMDDLRLLTTPDLRILNQF